MTQSVFDDPAPAIEATDEAIARTRAKCTPDGRFLRYCRGRARHAPTRSAIALAFGLVLVAMTGTLSALVLALPPLAITLLDWLLLRGLGRRDTLPRPLLRRYLALTVLTGLLEAATVSLFLTQIVLSAGDATRLFAIAATVALLLDATLLFGLNRGAAAVRIGVYLLALLFVFLRTNPETGADLTTALLDGMATVLLMLMGLVLTTQAHRNRERNDARQLQLLKSARDLARSNAELIESRAMARRLATVAEQINDSIIITDPEGTIIWVNGAFSNATGYRPEEALGMPVCFLNGPETDPEAINLLMEARRTASAARTEILNRRKDGTMVWAEVSLTPLLDDQGRLTAMIGVEREIAAIKEREHALAEARRLAEEARDAKHAFLATMSHEIRTPMNGVIGNAELLADTDLSETQRALVATITSSGEALLAIVNDILDYSSLETGRLHIAQRPFSPREVLTGVIGLITPLAEAKHLRLSAEIPPTLAPLLVGDGGRLRQVLVNLLGNAVKFTHRGDVTLSVTAQPSARGQLLRIEVSDTGIGIPADRLGRIFDGLTQTDVTMAGRFAGAGLGLAISRQLVLAIGGTIEAQSTLGEGSSFVVTLDLPLATSAAADSTLMTAAEGDLPAVSCLAGLTVLVADDNRANAVLLSRMLGPSGIRLLIAHDGREAVDMYCQVRPDLVLMDMRMPILDGVEATREIRHLETERHWPRTPVIALTANAFAEDRALCTDAGMTGFLTKPLRKRDLLEAMVTAVAEDGEQPLGGHSGIAAVAAAARSAQAV